MSLCRCFPQASPSCLEVSGNSCRKTVHFRSRYVAATLLLLGHHEVPRKRRSSCSTRFPRASKYSCQTSVATLSDSAKCAEQHITSRLQHVSSEASRKRVFTTASISLSRCFPQASPTSLEVSGNLLSKDCSFRSKYVATTLLLLFHNEAPRTVAVVDPSAFDELPSSPVKPLCQRFPTV